MFPQRHSDRGTTRGREREGEDTAGWWAKRTASKFDVSTNEPELAESISRTIPGNVLTNSELMWNSVAAGDGLLGTGWLCVWPAAAT